MSAVPGATAGKAKPKGLFSKIKDAKARLDANYIREGHYWCVLEKVDVSETRKGKPFVAVRMRVAHLIEQTPESHRPGEDVTHWLDATADMFEANFKQFAMTATELPENEIDEEACEEICADDNPLEGLILEVNARKITTRDGNPFTAVNYVRVVQPSELAKAIPEAELLSRVPNFPALLDREKMMEESES